MSKTKRFAALTLAAALTVGLAGCDNAAEETPTSGAGEGKAVYRTLYAGEVSTLNYLVTSKANETAITYNVVDCLVEYDPYANVEPALALSWESNDDATVWTFHLREGVKWVDKDGNEVAEVTAADFVTSAHYVCDARNDSDNFSTYKGIIAGASEYYNYTAYLLALEGAVDGTDENGNPCKLITKTVNGQEVQEVLEEVPEAALEDIGVKALDDYTLEYTLTGSRPYFISMVSFGSYMPTYGPFLAEKGAQFGTSNENLLYCGAFILSSFKPQQERVLTRNPLYWESDQVFLDEIRQTYNAEATTIATTMYLNGEVDQADVSSDLLSAMLASEETADQIHPSRANTSYSYFYLFNFDPKFDAEYEPENWSLAVNNENFRHAVTHAFNRLPALSTGDAINPTGNINNTITPSAFAAASRDYTTYGGLSAYTEGDNFDEALAVQYRDKARTELTEAGATFPIKMLICYNPQTANWANECQVVEQQIEKVLGADFIDIIVEAGPADGFLSTIRRGGKYAFMKCNWGADYADPETWTDPFSPDSSYNFIFNSASEETLAVYGEYWSMVEQAKAITDDMDARFEAFAKAETFFLDHAFAIPYSISASGYSMSRLNPFEGQFAPFGGANQRYKGQHLQEKSMSIDEFNTAYAQWQEKLG